MATNGDDHPKSSENNNNNTENNGPNETVSDSHMQCVFLQNIFQVTTQTRMYIPQYALTFFTITFFSQSVISVKHQSPNYVNPTPHTQVTMQELRKNE